MEIHMALNVRQRRHTSIVGQQAKLKENYNAKSAQFNNAVLMIQLYKVTRLVQRVIGCVVVWKYNIKYHAVIQYNIRLIVVRTQLIKNKQ